MIRLSLALLIVCLLAASPATAHFANSGSSCGSVQLQPRTDFAAFDIKAKRVSCRGARSLARSVAKRGTSRGYYCRFRSNSGDSSNGIAHTDYRCKRGRRVVTFAVS